MKLACFFILLIISFFIILDFIWKEIFKELSFLVTQLTYKLSENIKQKLSSLNT